MPDVKSTALLPRGEANGLAAVADLLQKEPRRLRAALVILDCKRGTEDYDQDDTVVTVRIRRVELLLPQDIPMAEQMIRRALEFRSGQTTLELELETEIREAFEQMKDPDGPEDPDDPDDPPKAKRGRK
jgi:hypothetical protein